MSNIIPGTIKHLEHVLLVMRNALFVPVNIFTVRSGRSYQPYALVPRICYHAPTPQGIAGTIPAKSPTLRGLLVGKTTGVFSRSLLFYFTFSRHFCLYKAKPEKFTRTAVAKLWPKPCSFPWLPPPCPECEGPWSQMTSAYPSVSGKCMRLARGHNTAPLIIELHGHLGSELDAIPPGHHAPPMYIIGEK